MKLNGVEVESSSLGIMALSRVIMINADYSQKVGIVLEAENYGLDFHPKWVIKYVDGKGEEHEWNEPANGRTLIGSHVDEFEHIKGRGWNDPTYCVRADAGGPIIFNAIEFHVRGVQKYIRIGQ